MKNWEDVRKEYDRRLQRCKRLCEVLELVESLGLPPPNDVGAAHLAWRTNAFLEASAHGDNVEASVVLDMTDADTVIFWSRPTVDGAVQRLTREVATSATLRDAAVRFAAHCCTVLTQFPQPAK